MATKPKNNKESFISVCNALVGGVGSLPDKSFLLGGETVAKADALSPMQAYVAAEEEVTTADAAYRAAVAKAHAAAIPARAMVAELKPYLRARLGKTNPVLETQFGIPVVTPPATPVASKAAGAVKAKATRAAKKAAAATAEKPAAPAAKPAV